jgi:putative transposase
MGTLLGEGSSSVRGVRRFGPALPNWWSGHPSSPDVAQNRDWEGFSIWDVAVEPLNRPWATMGAQARPGPLLAVSPKVDIEGPAEHGMAGATAERSGRWHVSFVAPQPVFERSSSVRMVGLDAGVLATLTT